MNELVAIVEGPTEQTFVLRQLQGHLPLFGTNIWPVLPGKHRRQGGVKKWEVAQQDIIRTLREGRYCTTMFDYYAMPHDWPGRSDSAKLPWEQRAAYVEAALLKDITTAMGGKFDPKFFIPYVQLHEFEALTFSDVNGLASVAAPLKNQTIEILAEQFQEILDEAKHPEAINDGYETCPSRRIAGIVPAYRKRIHGPIVTSRIGLEVLRAECDHFASWVDRLENITVKH
jgi:hypothetical protein